MKMHAPEPMYARPMVVVKEALVTSVTMRPYARLPVPPVAPLIAH